VQKPEDDDFHILTQEDAIRRTSQITMILQVLLASIAAISLLVGGIGIMNIMYVSVTERIREIGLRKSIGATRADILSQFLVEAVFVTTMGGAIGVALGILFTWLAIQIILQFQGGWAFVLSVPGILLGLGVSMAIGILFGFAPARKAAALRPMEALRHE
jgi:putative ABC transport system permease protein